MLLRNVLFCCAISLAPFAASAPTTYADALKFARDQVAKHPSDAKSRFALARVLSVGFADSPSEIDVTLDESTGLVLFPDSDSVMVKHSDGPLSDAEKGYLKEAITNYNRATRFDSSSALYALGYAWMFEQLAWRYSEVVGSGSFSDFQDKDDVWAKVSAELRRASYLSKDRDVKKPHQTGADAYVSRSAAENLLRLSKAGKARVTAAEAKRLKTQIDKVNKIAG